MTTRDRLVIVAITSLVLLAAVWLLAVSPERKKAASLAVQVSAASSQLASAETQLANAREAQTRYAAAYASIVSLGKAVPASEEVPSLIYELAQDTHEKNVDFTSIVSNATGSTATTSAATTATATAASAAAASAGFSKMPFTFVFTGTFSDLYHLFEQLNRSTLQSASGKLSISGRLLTIQSAKLGPVSGSGTTGNSSNELTGTVTATAYVLPAGQQVTGGATPTSPTGAATPASSSGSAASSTVAPAIVRAP